MTTILHIPQSGGIPHAPTAYGIVRSLYVFPFELRDYQIQAVNALCEGNHHGVPVV
jgi:hypothetical protein